MENLVLWLWSKNAWFCFPCLLCGGVLMWIKCSEAAPPQILSSSHQGLVLYVDITFPPPWAPLEQGAGLGVAHTFRMKRPQRLNLHLSYVSGSFLSVQWESPTFIWVPQWNRTGISASISIVLVMWFCGAGEQWPLFPDQELAWLMFVGYVGKGPCTTTDGHI